MSCESKRHFIKLMAFMDYFSFLLLAQALHEFNMDAWRRHMSKEEPLPVLQEGMLELINRYTYKSVGLFSMCPLYQHCCLLPASLQRFER